METPNYHDYYTWQSDVPGFSHEAQETLRSSTASSPVWAVSAVRSPSRSQQPVSVALSSHTAALSAPMI
ncbi:MAG: hypothetical protein K9N23_14870 [Akkermansiaceae bacterium]|nr:hypothetical protein [Akkermansiaceae bacterium]